VSFLHQGKAMARTHHNAALAFQVGCLDALVHAGAAQAVGLERLEAEFRMMCMEAMRLPQGNAAAALPNDGAVTMAMLGNVDERWSAWIAAWQAIAARATRLPTLRPLSVREDGLWLLSPEDCAASGVGAENDIVLHAEWKQANAIADWEQYFAIGDWMAIADVLRGSESSLPIRALHSACPLGCVVGGCVRMRIGEDGTRSDGRLPQSGLAVFHPWHAHIALGYFSSDKASSDKGTDIA
jgi:hypothetical protein